MTTRARMEQAINDNEGTEFLIIADVLDRLLAIADKKGNGRAARGLPVDASVRDLALSDRHLESVDVRIVFEYWRRITGKQHGATKLTPERRRVIQARLKDGYTIKEIMRAIEGCGKSDFHMARGEYAGGKKYNDLTLILRNGSKLEGFREYANGDDKRDMRAFL